MKKDPDSADRYHCIEMFEKLSEYLDGELDAATCEEIEAHIEHCVPCKICLITLKRTVNLCRGVKQNPVPQEFSQRLMQLIEDLKQNHPPPPKTPK